MTAELKVYFSMFRIRFNHNLQYRAAVLGAILKGFLWSMMEILGYLAIYRVGGDSLPMELSRTVSYVWAHESFFVLFSVVFGDGEIYSAIRTGEVGYGHADVCVAVLLCFPEGDTDYGQGDCLLFFRGCGASALFSGFPAQGGGTASLWFHAEYASADFLRKYRRRPGPSGDRASGVLAVCHDFPGMVCHGKGHEEGGVLWRITGGGGSGGKGWFQMTDPDICQALSCGRTLSLKS